MRVFVVVAQFFAPFAEPAVPGNTLNYNMRTLSRIGLACAALVLFSTVLELVFATLYWEWNDARLMPSFALAHGMNYYVTLARGGPLYTTVYGPMVAVVYLPATLFPSPNSAVLA